MSPFQIDLIFNFFSFFCYNCNMLKWHKTTIKAFYHNENFF
ncbi:hypothetical protein HMPREF0766_10757 [Sphingobacterium spiritivorum ATCC 33861]|uniref:Uncharacterized protein n=1 Tax=Sphingobacterium spiritivorum ATCC 33861 TaxID=525373 RepID=D7VID8_SPHSI|nr:hypothetical protein HMPREF0766_10757 [Sphingobacterium spiritivorum ATCC 33861]